MTIIPLVVIAFTSVLIFGKLVGWHVTTAAATSSMSIVRLLNRLIIVTVLVMSVLLLVMIFVLPHLRHVWPTTSPLTLRLLVLMPHRRS